MFIVYDDYVYVVFVFFFKQKTAYEMRISDWSSDVCSSDLTLQEHVWVSIETQFRQATLFAAPAEQAPPRLDEEGAAPQEKTTTQEPEAVPTKPTPVAVPADPAPHDSGDWIGDHSGWFGD